MAKRLYSIGARLRFHRSRWPSRDGAGYPDELLCGKSVGLGAPVRICPHGALPVLYRKARVSCLKGFSDEQD